MNFVKKKNHNYFMKYIDMQFILEKIILVKDTYSKR